MKKKSMPHKAGLCRCAEAASHPAADLRRNADALTVLILHDNGFTEFAVRQMEQIFHRSVYLGNKLLLDGVRYNECVLIKGSNQRFRQIRHFFKRHRLLCMKPVENLFCPKRRQSPFF